MDHIRSHNCLLCTIWRHDRNMTQKVCFGHHRWAFCSVVLRLRGCCTRVSYFIMCKYFLIRFLCHQLSCRLIYKMVVRQLVILWSALYIVWKRRAVAVRLTRTAHPTKSHIQQLAICVDVLIGVSYNMAVLEKTHIQYRIYIYYVKTSFKQQLIDLK